MDEVSPPFGSHYENKMRIIILLNGSAVVDNIFYQLKLTLDTRE